MHPVDVAVALLAEQQEGRFARYQAKAVGADDSLMYRRVRSGRWLWETNGVFALPGFPRTDRAAVRTSLLDAGPRAGVGHTAAAALHRVEGFHLAPPSILVPHGSHHENSLAIVHQTRLMPEFVTVQGFPTTPLLRTALDLSSVVAGPVRLGRVIDELVVRDHIPLESFAKGLEWMRAHRRPGTSVLEQALEGRTHGFVPSRSDLERLLDAITATIPGEPPEHEVDLPNRTHEPHRVDRIYRNPPLILEGDGRLWHARLAAMERDKQRDRHALRLGYPTARYSWPELRHDAREVRAELIALLGRG